MSATTYIYLTIKTKQSLGTSRDKNILQLEKRFCNLPIFSCSFLAFCNCSSSCKVNEISQFYSFVFKER